MWADSTKMSTNASRGAMLVHRFRVLRLPAIPRFIDSLPRLGVSQNGIQGPMTIDFLYPSSSRGAHHLDKLRQRHGVQKGAFVLRKSTTRYWTLSEILLWFG